MSAPPEATEPSGTSEPEQELERKWVALLSNPVILDDDDDRDMVLELDDPPRPSRLLVRNRCTRDPRRLRDTDPAPSAFILAAAADRSSRLLVQYGEGGILYLVDADPSARTVTRLPRVPSSLREKSLDLCPDRSIGLIAHPHSPAHFVVGQLHSGRHLRPPRHQLLYYSTSSRRGTQTYGRWNSKELAQPEGCTRDPSAEHGVIAHDGRFWWLALAYGLFFCDPLGSEPLRFVPLPAGCELGDDIAHNPGTRTLVKQRRCVCASEGKLRFVEIHGLSYDADVPEAEADATVKMWTLVDPDGPVPWEEVDYEARFAEIWEDKRAGLPRRKIPNLAFVDPDDHAVVYFLHGSNLFSVDLRKRKKVVAYEGYGGGDGVHRRMVYPWKMSTPAVTPMERAFPAGTYLRIIVSEFNGISGFVEPKEDGREIMINAWGERMPHSAWMVDYINCRGKSWMLLQSSAYGCYLARHDEGMELTAAVIVKYQQPEQEEILWEFRMEEGIGGGQGFLINAKHGIWNVNSEDCKLELEPILSTSTPPCLPPPPADVPFLRSVRLLWMNDAGGFTKGYAEYLWVSERSVCELRNLVLKLVLDAQAHPEPDSEDIDMNLGFSHPDSKDIILCVQPGTCGRLTPLVTDLPRSVEEMVIVVLRNGSSAVEALRYPTLDEA